MRSWSPTTTSVRGAYLAATNRGAYVVENFQRTPAVADGLAVMAQGYILLGYDELAGTPSPCWR